MTKEQKKRIILSTLDAFISISECAGEDRSDKVLALLNTIPAFKKEALELVWKFLESKGVNPSSFTNAVFEEFKAQLNGDSATYHDLTKIQLECVLGFISLSLFTISDVFSECEREKAYKEFLLDPLNKFLELDEPENQ